MFPADQRNLIKAKWSGTVFRMIMIMTLQQYKSLSEEQQMYFFKRHAVIVSILRRDNEVYTLFQIYGFYAEVFSYGTEGLMSSINYFDDTDFLEAHLKLINISPIHKVLNLEN